MKRSFPIINGLSIRNQGIPKTAWYSYGTLTRIRDSKLIKESVWRKTFGKKDALLNYLYQMGLFGLLKSAFYSLFNIKPTKRFDDTEIQSRLRNFPKSLPELYTNEIDRLTDTIHKVYCTANNAEFTIGIIGDYSVGKSSFINAIIGKKVLPVSVNPCTAIITKIKYGRSERAIVRYLDGQEKEMTYEEYLTYSSFNMNDFNERAASGEMTRFKDVVHATVFINSDFLKKNNLCIVDTLGLSANENDNKKTIAAISDAIAIIYLCGERGLSSKDDEFISEYLPNAIVDSFICINRIDLVREDELKRVSNLVNLKIDSILSRIYRGVDIQFPPERIYQVSSLYQEFANGQTTHKDWRKGVDYAKISGFIRILSDLGVYIENNAGRLRQKAVISQLSASKNNIMLISDTRKAEIEMLICSIDKSISALKNDLEKVFDNIAYIDSLFEGLTQQIWSYMSGIYLDFSKEVNNNWDNGVMTRILDQMDFGVGKYLALEKSVLAVKMNIFTSDKDCLYAKIDSLSQFIKPIKSFLHETLLQEISNLNLEIITAIYGFAEKYSYDDLFRECESEIAMMNIDSTVQFVDVLSNSMSRAAALAGIESTWVKNRARQSRMLNAAKTEGLKILKKPIEDFFQKDFKAKIKAFVLSFNFKATANLHNKKKSINSQLSNLEAEKIDLLNKMKVESKYFNSLSDLLTNSIDTIQLETTK